MPPKKIEERDLQAVVLCDSYEERFYPLTKDKPRCLLPLANTPLIEYTLEFLVSAKVTEVYLMCCSHADQVTEYITRSRWGSQSPHVPFKLHTIELPNTLSVGDAMRDLDSRGIIKSDFLLISGDVVCNMDFNKIWDGHVKRKQQDKNCIMTSVLRQGAATHRTRPRQTGLYILNQETNQVVGYEWDINVRKVSLDATELLSRPSVAFRNDLIDCYIDICTPDVPALFQENFDYELLRRDFVNGILTSDLLGKAIYAHILTDDYAARVESFRTYDAVSRDVIGRYAYPLVVDSRGTYVYRKGHIYVQNNVVLSQSSHIGRNTVIGRNTKVGSNTVITNSVIGRNCTIGDSVVLKDAYIWDDVTIHDNVKITESLVGSNAIVGAGAVLNPGVIVGFGHAVEANADIAQNSRLCRSFSKECEVSDDEDDENNHNEMGLLTSRMDDIYLSDDSIASTSRGDSNRRTKKTKRSLSAISATSVMSARSDEGEEDFFNEAVESISRAILDNHSQDVSILELNTLRMTMNASYDKVQAAVIHALVRHISHLVTHTDPKTATVGVFRQFTPLLKRVTFDLDDEVMVAHCIESECVGRNHGESILIYAMMTLYDTDVISEEAVYKWWDGEAVSTEVRKLVAQWVDWLRNAESESDEEESD
ncbi:Translation initiation factor eIF-2B subunit epsilon [Wickerhamiella sorbophila]|uniref:Translation initiation factor eIF2B subunit epsilon n=1 Tax=Wickerhamiella sorbophila TaxID=45607 RepID=A0A2T0FPZ1_9ASCO|nr:Translation initiation factor eIF-2B subunit epsilon [Wickerhamiella sorbophila]PRT57051.1 Translation initiation factor eIF-2B subunit epsilon [Wickerhamiella sorbophila]